MGNQIKSTRRKRSVPINHLNVEETAIIIGVSHKTLQQRLTPWGTKKWGKFDIPAKKHNGTWIFRRSDVENYMLSLFDEKIDIDDLLERLRAMDQPLKHIKTCLNTGLMRTLITTDS